MLCSPGVRITGDRIATGSFLLYYLGVSSVAQSGVHSPVLHVALGRDIPAHCYAPLR